jgi:hypothetical protein
VTQAQEDVLTGPAGERQNHAARNHGLADRRGASYLGGVLEDPIIAPSAFKHGLGAEDILHAYRNPIRVWDLGDGFTMMLGPNSAAIILEVGYVEGDTAVVIVHAMRARKRFLE